MLILALIVAVVAALRGLWSPCGLSMMSSLNPVAERARGNRPGWTSAWYLLGAVAGGAALGGVAAVLALVPMPARVGFAVAAAAAVVTAASDLRVLPVSLPEHPRQVNERWLSAYRRWVYALGFGAQIGTGFATYIMTAANYLVVVLAVLSGPSGALLTGLVFGLVRGAEVLVALTATTPQRLRALLARIDALGPASLAVSVAVQAMIAIVAAALAGGAVLGSVVGAGVAVVAAVAAVRHREVVAGG